MNKNRLKYILESVEREYIMEAETKSELTLNDLYVSTDDERRSRAKNQIDRVDAPKVRQEGNIVTPAQIDPAKAISFEFNVLSGKSHHTYVTNIRLQDSLASSSKVKVSCTCPDFKFRVGWVLHQKKALYNPSMFPDIMKNNPPNGSTSTKGSKGTNPDFKKYICKHLVACCDALMNDGVLKR